MRCCSNQNLHEKISKLNAEKLREIAKQHKRFSKAPIVKEARECDTALFELEVKLIEALMITVI